MSQEALKYAEELRDAGVVFARGNSAGKREATRPRTGGSMHEAKLTLTVEQAATLLGISRGLAYEMVRAGKIPAIRLGRRVVIPQRALERLLEDPTRSDSNSGVS